MRIALFMLAILLTTRTAKANCGCDVKTAPESSDVPLHGSLYLGAASVLKEGHVSVSWVGSPGTWRWTVADEIARLDYEGPDGSELVLTTFKRYERGRYKLSSAWRAPSSSPHVIGVDHHESSWTCASTDVLAIQLDQSTAAVRIRWTRAGQSKTWFEVADGRLALGLKGCCGQNIDPNELHDGGELELVAVRVDGSEARIEGLPTFVMADLYTMASSFSDNGEPMPADPRLAPWLRFLISLGLVAAAAAMSRCVSARFV